MSPPLYLKGRAIKHSAQTSARRWRQLRFDDLSRDACPTQAAQLRLPIFQNASKPSSVGGSVAIDLRTNTPALMQWWMVEHFGFIVGDDVEPTTSAAAAPLICSEVNVHVGPPRRMGYPHAIEVESANWTEGFLRSEAHAYRHGDSGGEAFLSPVRWIDQPLLDGFVSRRLDAHRGVTTQAMLDARQHAKFFGRHIPPHEVSPYYAAHELLDRWLLFGDEHQLVPREAQSSSVEAAGKEVISGDAQEHLRRVMQLALGSAMLSSLQGVWVSGAVVTHRRTGDSVLIVGPRQSGKTTLALHCLNAFTDDCMLTATEDFFLAPGDHMLDAADGDASPAFLQVSVPSAVPVGLGALLGSLRPNPPLAAHVQAPLLATPQHVEQLLVNSDGVIWNMNLKYRASIPELEMEHATAASQRHWCPAVLGRINAIVLLDWCVEELYSSAPVDARTSVTRESPRDGWMHLEKCARDGGGSGMLIRRHHLLGRASDEAGWDRLVDMLGTSEDTMRIHRISGSVNFDVAVETVHKLLCNR